MTTTLMNPLDAAFLQVESDTTLAHVGGLYIFRLPPGAGPDFVRHAIDEARCHTSPTRPFDRRPAPGLLSQLVPRWEIVTEIDLDYHFQHHALPRPGSQRELGILISRLHSTRLDRARPLWECHVIEGLEGDRFAVYAKMHHALTDGIGAVRLTQKTLSEDSDAQGMPPMWAHGTGARRRTRAKQEKKTADGITTLMEQLRRPVRGARTQLAGAQALARVYTGWDLPRLRRTGGALARPYAAPRSILNGPITAHRRVATQSYEMDRIRAVAQRTGGTVNDVVLAICAGGLRRYLAELDALPNKPLVAGVPMSFRLKDSEEDAGNAVTFTLASLATDIADVRQRFAAIAASSARAKEHMSRLPRAAIANYTMLLMAPFIGVAATGTGSRVPPMFNLVISNVPGPKSPLYFNGAGLEESYPLSIPINGQALNITVLSYVDRLNFSFTACGATLPHVQRLSVYCGEALTELEKAYAG